MSDYSLANGKHTLSCDGSNQVVWTEDNENSLLIRLTIANTTNAQQAFTLTESGHVLFTASISAKDTRVEQLAVPINKGSNIKAQGAAGLFLTVTTVERNS